MRLPQNGWVKAQLHAHSTRSDGRLDPEKAVEFYARAGFGAVSLTDHNKVTPVSHPSVLTPPGVEVAAREEGVAGEYHVVIIGCGELPPESARKHASKLFDWCRDNGFYSFVAHPYWSMLSGSDLLKAGNPDGVEVYNHGCEVEISRGYSGPHWDYALSKGVMLQGLAVDDVHTYTVDALGGWVVLDLADHSVEALLEALKQGRFYASSGVEVEAYDVEQGRAWLKCSGAKIVKLLSGDTKGAYLSVSMLDKLAAAQPQLLEVERWEDGFRIRAKDLRVEGRLRGGSIVELEIAGQLPVKGYMRVELIDGEKAAWLNTVRL